MSVSTVTFKAGGRTHKLRLTTRAACEVEDTFGKPLPAILADAEGQFGFRFARSIFAACLENGAGVDQATAEGVIDDVGGLKPAADRIGEMIAKAFPDEAGDAGGASGNAKEAG